MKKNPCQIWVSPEYKKKLKVEASKRNMTVIEWSKELAKKTEEDSIDEKTFNFRF